MTAFPFWNESVPDRHEAALRKPIDVSRSVGVVPEHGSAQVLFDAGPTAIAKGGEENSILTQPLTNSRKQSPLVLEWHVNQGVEGDDGVKGTWFGIPADHVSLNEGCTGYQFASPLNLDGRMVHADHLKASFNQLERRG